MRLHVVDAHPDLRQHAGTAENMRVKNEQESSVSGLSLKSNAELHSLLGREVVSVYGRQGRSRGRSRANCGSPKAGAGVSRRSGGDRHTHIASAQAMCPSKPSDSAIAR
jgi:hypothetical protein